MSFTLRLSLMAGLLGLAAVLRLPETRLVALIAVDYACFCALYRLAKNSQARSFANDCRALIENYNVGDELARKLARYWSETRR